MFPTEAMELVGKKCLLLSHHSELEGRNKKGKTDEASWLSEQTILQ